MLKKLFILVTILGCLVGSLGAILGGYLIYDVFFGDYEHLEKKKILEILSKETIVFFNDGSSQVGSLFGNEHRQYVPLPEIPKNVPHAVIAAEDGSFYQHLGVDFLSTARALVRNIISNRREGASTITQQTVKNLYGRPVTNLRAKFLEAINAFKMERVYAKEDILEFYLNQFHVVGNGRGVGVAAKYYFNKDVQELSLVEAAFIAGSVKGPELYNPFTKRSLQSRDRAIQRAFERKNYVLRRMLEQSYITQTEYDEASQMAVPFEQGRFQFNQLSVLDLVKRQLSRPEVMDALGVENIEQIATMGLKITTTLNKDIQQAAQYGVRQNLSRLGIILKGFQTEEKPSYSSLSRLTDTEFYVGKVSTLDMTPGKELVDVNLGLAHCIIPAEGVARVAKFLDYGVYKGLKAAKDRLYEKLKEGEHVLVSVKGELDPQNLPPWIPPQIAAKVEPEELSADKASEDLKTPENSTQTPVHSKAWKLYHCDLESSPEINGAAIAIDKGEILAVVGGYSPTEYNRAVYSRRQPGSTFKTHTFYAALHLGWNALDPLLNVRDAYEWQGQFYYPRPDHAPASITTTFVGAGAFSENLASVWLLANLTKKLSPSQLRELLIDLQVIDGSEDDGDLTAKLRDTFNVRFSRDDLNQGILNAIIDEYAQDLAIVADKELYMVLSTLSYGGLHYEQEAKRIAELKDKNVGDAEKRARLSMLRNNTQTWQKKLNQFKADLQVIADAIESGNYFFQGPELTKFQVTASGRLGYLADATDRYSPTDFSRLVGEPALLEVRQEEILLRIEEYLAQGALDFATDVRLDHHMPVSLIEEILELHRERADALEDRPVSEKIPYHFDLRYSAGMLFARNLVERMGVLSQLDWVPSFPLGTNEVSLAELAMTYQTFLEGKLYRFFTDDQAANQLALLKRIEDSAGNLLWESEPKEEQVFDPFYTPSLLSILRGTVTHGTGRIAGLSLLLHGTNPAAPEELRQAKIRVPSFGKTGTTNDYVNAVYAGFLPYPPYSGIDKLNPSHAITIATYVGYDDNQRMRKPGVRIAGGTGALPAWITIAQAIIDSKKYEERLNWQSLVENGINEVDFDYGQTTKITVPLHSSVVLSSDLDRTLEKVTANLDPDVVADDYAKSDEEIITVSLPGRIDHGVFSPRVRISFLPEADELSLPAEIPELDTTAFEREVEDADAPEERFARKLPSPPPLETAEDGYNFLIPPAPPRPEQNNDKENDN